MTFDALQPPTRTRVLTGDQVRELVALALVVLGLAGLAACAWMWDGRLGGAVLSIEAVAVGLWLGLDR